MNILLLNQFFPPDLAPTGQMAADLAEDLVAAGHSVTVLASQGDYLGGDRHESRTTWRGVEVVRVAATSLGKRTLVHRALDYSSFYASAGWMLRRLDPPDVIVAMTTPPLIAAAGLGARRKGTKLVYWVQDLYPEIAVAFGAIGESALHTRAMASVSRRVMQASAQVVVLGEAMREKAVAAGAHPDRVSVIPNWADGGVVRPIPHESNPLREDLARGAHFVVLYSGNIGRAHDVSTMVGAARKLSDRSDIAFVFQGGGTSGRNSSWEPAASPTCASLPTSPGSGWPSRSPRLTSTSSPCRRTCSGSSSRPSSTASWRRGGLRSTWDRSGPRSPAQSWPSGWGCACATATWAASWRPSPGALPTLGSVGRRGRGPGRPLTVSMIDRIEPIGSRSFSKHYHDRST